MTWLQVNDGANLSSTAGYSDSGIGDQVDWQHSNLTLFCEFFGSEPPIVQTCYRRVFLSTHTAERCFGYHFYNCTYVAR